ncbi:hypothetical protein [Pseudoalteromonas ulvae]|uniref:PKD domain-containing protein n=1 Tax=Pseudoalteromonas ulvae TaxID=107327 RepID=A0A244CLA6_PSEDV|nr:hypothetical protein [Pseudoalteromonas ulvae]OUL56403.1 hypothetical protein B1199_17175 [Pseudoalteromonas ulvae]
MRIFAALLVSFFLTACGGGSKQQPPVTPVEIVKKAPSLTLSAQPTAQSGTITTINFTIEDTDSTDFSLDWKFDHDQASLLSASMSQASLQLPHTSTQLSLKVTLTVTDESNLSVTQSHIIDVLPVIDDIDITLPTHSSVATNEYITLSLTAKSNAAITAIDWQLPLALQGDTGSETELNDKQAQSTLTLKAPALQNTTEFDIKVTVSTDYGYKNALAKLTVTADDTPYLSITVPESITVKEGQSAQIDASISSSGDTAQYMWAWQNNTAIELSQQTTAQVRFDAPEVEQDQQYLLNLTVTSDGLTQTKTVTVLITNNAIESDIKLTTNRTLAVKGQPVIVSVETEQASLIQSVKWSVDGLAASDYSYTNNELTITVPALSDASYQDVDVQFTATMTDNQTITRTQSLRVLNGEQLFQHLKVEPTQHAIPIYKNELNQFSLGISGTTSLIDRLSIDMPFVIYEFSTRSAELKNNQAHITLASNLIEQEKQTHAQLTLYAGEYSVMAMIPVYLHPSHYKVYAGVKETYFAGSTLSLFGQLFHDGVRQTNLTEHQFNWQDQGRGSFDAPENIRSQYTSSKYINTDTQITLNHQYDTQSSQSSVTHSWTRLIRESKGDMNCFNTINELKCTFNGQPQTFTIDASTIKQVVVANQFACLLNDAGLTQCVGDTTHPSVTTLIAGNDGARINLVGEEDICVQKQNGQWQCAGENSHFNQSLLPLFSNVYQIIKHQQHTCLVGDGFMHCYNNAGDEVFKDTLDTVGELAIKSSGICYKHTSNPSGSWLCPTF